MEKRNRESCAACRRNRKKCSEDCVFAPHFPSDDPDKFAIVQKVFGTNYILKLLQGLESEVREGAVNNMVYEANVREKDPINGTAGIVHEQKEKIGKLESQLAAKSEELVNMRSQYDDLLSILRTGSHVEENVYLTDIYTSQPIEEEIMYDEVDPLLLWELP
ncbi:hypothetical protein SUGI_0879690 [Cryptomeria japonica]|uniref:LOB domain-containing protein 24-like n=1 Tax=Cryptomeria japonica TaxID=3369 RepID=UPI002414C910|nr:LOB domain-containing protein 24-like [Cryptomeria japonica]GLJ42451.1 hypothetical protein SUGI_0879690 [Cryptomeria japonica]